MATLEVELVTLRTRAIEPHERVRAELRVTDVRDRELGLRGAGIERATDAERAASDRSASDRDRAAARGERKAIATGHRDRLLAARPLPHRDHRRCSDRGCA